MSPILANLKKNISAQMQEPKQLILLLVIVALFVDFLTVGKLKYINYVSYHVQQIFKGSDWQFIVILLLLLIRR